MILHRYCDVLTLLLRLKHVIPAPALLVYVCVGLLFHWTILQGSPDDVFRPYFFRLLMHLHPPSLSFTRERLRSCVSSSANLFHGAIATNSTAITRHYPTPLSRREHIHWFSQHRQSALPLQRRSHRLPGENRATKLGAAKEFHNNILTKARRC